MATRAATEGHGVDPRARWSASSRGLRSAFVSACILILSYACSDAVGRCRQMVPGSRSRSGAVTHVGCARMVPSSVGATTSSTRPHRHECGALIPLTAYEAKTAARDRHERPARNVETGTVGGRDTRGLSSSLPDECVTSISLTIVTTTFRGRPVVQPTSSPVSATRRAPGCFAAVERPPATSPARLAGPPDDP